MVLQRREFALGIFYGEDKQVDSTGVGRKARDVIKEHAERGQAIDTLTVELVDVAFMDRTRVLVVQMQGEKAHHFEFFEPAKQYTLDLNEPEEKTVAEAAAAKMRPHDKKRGACPKRKTSPS